MQFAAANEIATTPPVRPRPVVASLRRVPLPEALGRVAAISLVIAVILFAGLTLQMSLGGDPALGSKVSVGAASAAADSRVSTAASSGHDASAISAALAAQAQTQIIVPTQTAAPTPTAVAPTPSPPPTPVQTSTS